MTFQPTLRILAASIALALAGAAHAQAPAPATTPAPATSAAPAATPTPAPAAAPATKDRANRGTSPTQAPTGNALPRGTPGIAAVPGTASAGSQAAKGERNHERRPEGSGRQLQNAYADLMTPEELAAHRAKVKKTKTYAECKALFEATDKEMEARAKAQNKTVKATPTEICDRAKERGRVTG